MSHIHSSICMWLIPIGEHIPTYYDLLYVKDCLMFFLSNRLVIQLFVVIKFFNYVIILIGYFNTLSE